MRARTRYFGGIRGRSLGRSMSMSTLMAQARPPVASAYAYLPLWAVRAGGRDFPEQFIISAVPSAAAAAAALARLLCPACPVPRSSSLPGRPPSLHPSLLLLLHHHHAPSRPPAHALFFYPRPPTAIALLSLLAFLSLFKSISPTCHSPPTPPPPSNIIRPPCLPATYGPQCPRCYYSPCRPLVSCPPPDWPAQRMPLADCLHSQCCL